MESCQGCSHALAAHVSHLENVSEEEMNRLLGIMLDVEHLFTCVQKEEDADTMQGYFYLFKLLRQFILQRGKPVAEGSLEKKPLFEKPSIEQAVNTFVQYKFSHLPSKERQTIVELAKMFLNHINNWHLWHCLNEDCDFPMLIFLDMKRTAQGGCVTTMCHSSVTVYLGMKLPTCLGE